MSDQALSDQALLDQALLDQGLTYKKGSKVEVKNEDERKWYPATILNGHLDNTYDVEFEDDTQEYNVPEHLIKPLYGVQPVAKKTPLIYAPRSPDYAPRSPDYIAPSPDYTQPYHNIPRSPDYTPPGTPVNHLKVGDLVSYTKDFKNRMWKIDDLEGAYVTVATADTEGLERNYKVVPLNELIPYVPSSPPPAAQQSIAPQTPVVNVIVGDNNSVTPPEKPAESSTTQSSTTQSSLPQSASPQNSSSSYGLSSFSLSDESSDFSTPRVRIKDESKGGSSDANFLSGKSIVVKKI